MRRELLEGRTSNQGEVKCKGIVDHITMTQKERQGGGLFGGQRGTWRGARWRQLCWGHEACRVEEKTNERKESWKNMRLSQQVMSDSLLHCPQHKAPLPTLLIPLKVCGRAIVCLYPCQNILQNGGIRQSLQATRGYLRSRV